MYAKVQDGSVARYPYVFTDFKHDNPRVSFPRTALENESIRNEYSVVEVQRVEKPIQDGYFAEEKTPVLVDGVWRQEWELKEISHSELRKKEYGPVEKQIEFITENGLEAWQARVAEIKAKYPQSGSSNDSPLS
jgi:hypothetical protein